MLVMYEILRQRIVQSLVPSNITVGHLCLVLMFAGPHNQSPLLTMLLYFFSLFSYVISVNSDMVIIFVNSAKQ